ncbi:diacylglycerol kinase [Daeguia caeni]|uniref:Diacylglycerol kinase n=1 Tax=Daeguia caeni TaxID=439612 RepID=A0ABV9HAB5_9HYPH
MQRIYKAFFNSLNALFHLSRHEKAFQQELLLLAAGILLSFIVAQDILSQAILIGSIILILFAEIINTAIEKACDAITVEFNANIKLAKDCGSLAVLMSCLIALAVWIYYFHLYFFPQTIS